VLHVVPLENAKLPVMEIPVMFSDVEPVFVNVTIFAALVLYSVSVAKLSELR
jgi:hypothetical protein